MKARDTALPKIGRPRKQAEEGKLQAGAHVLLAGEIRKIRRSLKTMPDGRAFLARPRVEQDEFIRRLVVIASQPTSDRYPSPAMKAYEKSLIGAGPTRKKLSSPATHINRETLTGPEFSKAAEQVRRVRLKWLVECNERHPDVTDFALRRLRKRCTEIGKLSPDFWKTVLIGGPSQRDGKLSAETVKAMHTLRKESEHHAIHKSTPRSLRPHNLLEGSLEETADAPSGRILATDSQKKEGHRTRTVSRQTLSP